MMEREELSSYKVKTGYNLRQLELDYYQHVVLSQVYEAFNTIYLTGMFLYSNWKKKEKYLTRNFSD
jgi:hypothetical protein